MQNKFLLSVVIPCYNEENNIRRGVLDSVTTYLDKQPYKSEVIVVDDGSTDKSRQLIKSYILKHPQIQLVENPHQGKAKTVITGMLMARGDNILFTDFDQATPLSEIEKLLPYLKNSDIVIGSRNNKREGAPFSRIVMARGFMMLRNLILNLGIYDTQCGFKVFKKNAAQTIFKKLKLYKGRKLTIGSSVTAGFDVELLYLSKKLGYRIVEVPVVWNYVETRRVSPLRDSIEGLKDLLRIKIADMSGKYD
jgi:glycosyltransferase involved in cell wall biosynthesis